MTDKVMNVAERAPQTALRISPASIMVYVDFDTGCDKRIKIAADWAAKFNAALIGVAGWLPGGKPAAGLRLNWNRPKTRVIEYSRKRRNWEKAFERRSAEQSRRWNGEGASTFRVRSFRRRRARPIL